MKLIKQEILKIISTLPKARKKIYMMSRIKGMKVFEISKELNISVKTVETQISRVKIALRKAVSKIIF